MIINPIFVYLSLFYSFSHFLSPLLRICDLSHACYMPHFSQLLVFFSDTAILNENYRHFTVPSVQ